MRIPFLDALKLHIVKRVPDPLPPTVKVIEFKSKVIDEIEHPQKVLNVARAVIEFEQITDAFMSDEYIRVRATQAVAFHIYGPIETELRNLQYELYQLGLRSDEPAMQRIDHMIKLLRCEPQ